MEMQPEASLNRQPQNDKCILVIDDNPALLQTAKALFTDSTWHCLTQQDTVSALCAIVEHKPAAVLIDSETGPLDAWKCSILIKEHPEFRHTRVILAGRQDNLLVRARASAAGADAFLLKPFTAEEVLLVLEQDSGLAA